MVGRGGGRKMGNCKIASGRLQSCLQASRKNLLNKQNTGGISNTNPLITDEIALMVAKNLDRQRTAFTTNIPRTNESPAISDHVMNLVPESVDDTTIPNEGNGADDQHVEDEQASQGFIPSMTEGQLGKRKRESNFISRIEVGLQMNNALHPRPRANTIQNEVDRVNYGVIDGITATSKSKGKPKRGMYKSFVVDMKIKGKGSKLRVTIPEDIDRAIGENARHLVNECGRVVRTKAPFIIPRIRRHIGI